MSALPAMLAGFTGRGVLSDGLGSGAWPAACATVAVVAAHNKTSTRGNPRAVGKSRSNDELRTPTAGLPLVVVQPRQVREFARATGQLAKTDALDARALAPFADVIRPAPQPLPDAQTQELRALLGRRQPPRRLPLRLGLRLPRGLRHRHRPGPGRVVPPGGECHPRPERPGRAPGGLAVRARRGPGRAPHLRREPRARSLAIRAGSDAGLRGERVRRLRALAISRADPAANGSRRRWCHWLRRP